MVYDRYAGIVSLPGLDGKMPRPFRVDEDGNVIYLDKELNAVKRLGEEKPIQLAEAYNPNWNGPDSLRPLGERYGAEIRKSIEAVGDLASNYLLMREAKTIGADKYFHCKGNCEAASRSEGGESIARTISNAREILDQRVKDSPLWDSTADQYANTSGLTGGRVLREHNENRSNAPLKRGPACGKYCTDFRPVALDKRYE